MILDFLPKKYKDAINKIDISNLYELRLRIGYPIIANYSFSNKYLTSNGISNSLDNQIICDREDILEIIRSVTEHSLYAYGDKLRQGFLTTDNGVRIGIAGECVFDNEKIITIKNITSLLIRIPHEINGCANALLNQIKNEDFIYSTLIISPPFMGKTTILKDLARKLNNKYNKSILIIDERNEFSIVSGQNIDIIKYSNKSFAFNYAIRSLAPNLIITDELSGEMDYKFIENAINSGVKVVASCHASSIEELIRKRFFIPKLFERYVLLENKSVPGKIKSIYDLELNLI